MSCKSQNTNVYLNADDLGEVIFSNGLTENNNKLNNFDISTIDLKTLFEMLLMITTFGLKKYYGTNDGTVDITTLKIDELNNINSYLKKINIQLNIQIISRIHWVFGIPIKKYDEIKINSKTNLSDLKVIFDRGDYYIISFSKL